METQPNPNPLTKDKLKPGVSFAFWNPYKGMIAGSNFTMFMIGKNKIVKNQGQAFLVHEIHDDKMVVMDFIGGLYLTGEISFNEFCIVNE